MARAPMPDVVVVLPGILGSVLQRDGREIWGMSPGALLRGLVTLGRSIKDLRLEGDDPALDDLGDGVTASRLQPDVHLIPGFWKIDGYGKIVNTLTSRFEVTPGENLFEFPYDWRRDNRVAGRKLRRASHDWLGRWRQQSGNPDAKLVLLAHSMGGLVSRAFLELEEGWADTRALITFGTPYRGALNALGFMANGFEKKLGPLTILDLTELLRSLTSCYQLLPTYPCYDPGDGTLLRVGETDGIPNVDPARAGAALSFHREIEAAVADHQQQADYRERGYRIYPVIGWEQPTVQSAVRAREGVRLLRTIEGQDEQGDGTVPRVSAQPPEWTDPAQGMFTPETHASLQNHPAVLDHLRGVLTAGALDLGRRRLPAVSIDIADLFAEQEPVVMRGRAEVRTARLQVDVTDTDSGQAVGAVELGRPDSDGWRAAELAPLPPGIYRARLSSPADRAAVTDVFAVLGREGGE